MEKPTKEQFTAFQAIFDYYNEHLFENKLPGVLLNFSRKVKNVGGFFAPERWKGIAGDGDDRKAIHEISLNPEHFNKEPKWVISILVHEMVHLWQQEFGKIPRGGYHDKQWGEKMEAIGLMPSNTAMPGGKKTGQQMAHYVIEAGLFDLAYAEMPPDLLLPFEHVDPPPKVSTLKRKTKYVCRCDNKVWGKAGLSVTCNECGLTYESEDE